MYDYSRYDTPGYQSGISDADITNFYLAHAGDAAAINAAMAQYGVSADRVAALTGWRSAQAEPAEVWVSREPTPPAPPAAVTVAATPTVSDAAIVSFYQAHAGDAAAINAAMAQYGVSAERVTALTGWNPTQTTQQAASTPTPEQQRQQAMADYWNQYKTDPAKIYEGMLANNIGVNEAAQFLGVTPTEMANYLNSGRYAGSVSTGAGDNLDFHDIYKYEEVHREPQTRAEFETTIESWMLDANGRFKGPNDGVNYRWEGMTPDEVFQSWQPVPLDPSMARDGADGTQPQFCYLPGQAPYDPINLKWEPGYDNGGGVLGGMVRAVGNLGTGVAKNPALMMALTAGVINPFISTIGQTAGAGTALNTIGNILNAPGVTSGLMNFVRTGDLGSSVVAGFSSWAGGVVSGEITDSIVDLTGMPVDTARVLGGMTFTAISGGDLMGVINSGTSTISSIAVRTPVVYTSDEAVADTLRESHRSGSTPGDALFVSDDVAALDPSQVTAIQPGTASTAFNDANFSIDYADVDAQIASGYQMASNADSGSISTDNAPIDSSEQENSLQNSFRQSEIRAQNAQARSDRIDEFISEAKANKGLPFTGTLDPKDKSELYARLYRETASPNAITAFDNGEKVVFGIRHETSWNANSGRGVFDDRVVVLQRGADGASTLHYEGAFNTEPAGSYDQKSPNFGVGRTSTSPGSDKDVNGDRLMDSGRLIGNETYQYEWSQSGSGYGPAIYGKNNVLRSVDDISVERDVKHNGTYSFEAGNKAYASGKTILFHRGYQSFTGSAGCQTFPNISFAGFAASIAPTPSQSRFFYTLKNM